MKGFKNFLMRGDVIVVAVGLVVALAFSMPALCHKETHAPQHTVSPISSPHRHDALEGTRSTAYSRSARPNTARTTPSTPSPSTSRARRSTGCSSRT